MKHKTPCEATVIKDVQYFTGVLRVGAKVTVKEIRKLRGVMEASCEAPPGTPDMTWTHRDDGIINLAVPLEALRLNR